MRPLVNLSKSGIQSTQSNRYNPPSDPKATSGMLRFQANLPSGFFAELSIKTVSGNSDTYEAPLGLSLKERTPPGKSAMKNAPLYCSGSPVPG